MRKVINLTLMTIFISACAYFSPRPQDPSDRPYQIEKVRISGGAPDVILAGELTLPESEGPFEAIVMITGSGAQNRNEEIAGHRPFLVISDYLTRQGYAVLRTDDRGFGHSTGDFQSATMADFAEDAAASFRWLALRSDINSEKIGFLGHSEGGFVAPAAAQLAPASFLILLAGAALPLLPDVMLTQVTDIATQNGATADEIARERSLVLSITNALADVTTPKEAADAVEKVFRSGGATKQQIKNNVRVWGTQWGINYIGQEPKVNLKAFDGPALALFGSTDLQVSAKVNAPIMRENLLNPLSEVVVFDGLNHLFQPSESGSIDDYAKIDTTIDPIVLEEISRWLERL